MLKQSLRNACSLTREAALCLAGIRAVKEPVMSEEKQRLLARKEKIERRLAAIQETEERRRKKDEQRKAELAGRAVLKHALKDERFAAELRGILDAEVTAAAARALFGLPAGASSPERSKTRSGNSRQQKSPAAAQPHSGAGHGA
jgi:hypothetical protein